MSTGEWLVRVLDAVGLVVVDGVQLVIHPKIPQAHLIYLLEVGGYIPRVSHELGAADAGSSLWRLVARWFIGAAETVLRRDLLRDYHTESGELPAARGQVVALQTAQAYYAGRLSFECRYEEFGYDTPLNRVVKRAAQIVAGSTLLDKQLRRRAVEVLARMELVGALQDQDLRVKTDRNSTYYREAFGWARHVLFARGRTLDAGQQAAWTFLIRTPEPVEAGIREILQRSIGRAHVSKRGRRLDGTHLTINPDLVLSDSLAVADVKYKLCGSDWNRPDLYQLVTFAAGFRTLDGALINFCGPDSSVLPSLKVGDIGIRHLPWRADAALRPESAADEFVRCTRDWLDSVRKFSRTAVGDHLATRVTALQSPLEADTRAAKP